MNRPFELCWSLDFTLETPNIFFRYFFFFIPNAPEIVHFCLQKRAPVG